MDLLYLSHKFMGEYLYEKLRKENLVLVVENCKKALSKGFLTDSRWEKNQIEKVRKCRNLTWFCRNRKKSQREYDVFCSFLEKKLPRIDYNKKPLQKLSQLIPLFEKVLKIDGRRRAFDYTFNLKGNILDYYIEKLAKFLKRKDKKQYKDWLSNLINISPRNSLAYLEIKEILEFLIRFPAIVQLQNMKSILTFLIKLNAKLEFNPDIKNLIKRYAREDMLSLAKKLHIFINQYKGKEKDSFEKLIERKRELDRLKKQTENQIEKLLSQREKIKFKTLIKRVHYLIYINEYEDPLRNNNMDGLADYFLRKNVALCLHQLKKIKSSEPMDYPQRYLLSLAQKTIKNEYFPKNN